MIERSSLAKLDTTGGLLCEFRKLLGREDLQDFAVAATVFVLTYVLSQYYVAGDQVGYHGAYHGVRGVDPDFGFKVYRYFISTMEFIHYIVVYIMTNLSIDKNIFFASLNGLLAMMVFQIFRAKNVNGFVATFFVLTNFYMYVLYFSAERLKVAIIILLFGAYFVKNAPAKFTWLSISAAAHVTTILLFAGRLFRAIFDRIVSKDDPSWKKYVEIFIVVAVPAIAIYYFSDYILWKFYQYYSIADNSLIHGLPLFACITMSLYYSKDRTSVIFDYVPLVAAFLLLGGSRVNMFAYIIFLRHGLPANRGMNVGVLATTAYFAFKSAVFVVEVINSGQGF